MAGKVLLLRWGFVLSILVPVEAKAQSPITLEDFLDWENAGGAEIAPAGNIIVYRRTKVDAKVDRYDSDLWIMRADGSGARLLSDAWSPSWSPDGKLSYLIDGEKGPQLVVRDVKGVTEAEISAERPIMIDGPVPSAIEWSKDGASFAYVASVPRTQNAWPISMPKTPDGAKWVQAPTVVTGLHYRTGVEQYRSSDRHIFIAPAAGGQARQLTSGNWNVGSYYSGTGFGTSIEWTSDSKNIVFEGLADNRDDMESAQLSNINKVNIADGNISVLNTSKGFWRLPRVSPDGKLIVYTGNVVTGAAFERQQLRIMNNDGSQDRLLVSDLPDRIFQMEWSRKGDGILISMNHEGATKLWFVGLDGRVRTLAEGKFRFYLSSVSNGSAIGSLISQSRDSEIASVALPGGEIKRLTSHNAKVDQRALAQVEDVWAKSVDGVKVQGWVYRPADFDSTRKYPLILDIHGGPDAMAGYDFDFRYQDFAARGYVIATSNPGGSTGYGTVFANRIQGGFPGKKDRQDLEAFLDAVIARGSIDPERIYVMGCSGGGSLSAWLAAKTRRFAAATVMCPVTNWVSLAGTSDVTAWAYTRFASPYWEDPKPWIEHSPLFSAGKIDTPVLIANGARDQRTPTSQAAELYTALKVRGVPTRLLIFPNEGHGPWRSTPSNLLRLQLYIDEWFKTKGNPAAATP